jgi:hypothetical protein
MDQETTKPFFIHKAIDTKQIDQVLNKGCKSYIIKLVLGIDQRIYPFGISML